jgi:hypothetical protein
MSGNFVVRQAKDGLTVVVYRGEDMVLLAFDVDQTLLKPEFLGFGVQYRIGDQPKLFDVYNFLTFKQLREKLEALQKQATTDQQKDDARQQAIQAMTTMRSPLQTFRWAHVPSRPIDGAVTYRVSALFGDGDGPPAARATVEATIDIGSATRGEFLNVGFTRGFASSQAYVRRFKNDPKVLPAKNQHEIDFDTGPFEGDDRPYPWLGFEARRIMLGFLDECIADTSILVDAFAYDLSNPEIVHRLEALKDRLRIVIDNSGTHGRSGSEETHAATLLAKSAGAKQVKRHRFSGLQHNKVFIAKRKQGDKTVPFAVLTGSTNFALRGLYIQNNNVLLFRDDDIAGYYADAFAAGFPTPDGFKKNKVSNQWFGKTVADAGTYRFAFSPHTKAEISMQPLATAIKNAKSSVLYAIAFRGAQTGLAAEAIDSIDTSKLQVMGVADKPGGSKTPKGKKKSASGRKTEPAVTTVQLPGRGKVPLSPAALKKDLPPPFKAEWPGGSGVRMHHKFVICDFNGEDPVVYTGSSNLASGGEEGNGDNLIEIRDRKVAIAYAVQAVSIFDHYAYRVRMKESKTAPKAMDLAGPPAVGQPAWWANSFKPGHEKSRDRQLFAG